MEAKWKSTISLRMKQRNMNQREIYKDIMEAYTVLLDEKNKLLATIASLSENTNYLLRNSFNYVSDSISAKYSLKRDLSKEDVSKKDVSKEDSSKEDFQKKLFIKNNGSNNNSFFHSLNESLFHMHNTVVKQRNTNGSFQNMVTEKEFFDIIKEKGKNEELILLLKNSINEKEKWLNIVTKENDNLNKIIMKKEKIIFEKKKEISKLNDTINKNRLEMKLYLKDSYFLKKQLKSNEEEMKELVEEQKHVKNENQNLIRQVTELKKVKHFKDRECYRLAQKVLQLNARNERLLKHLLKCKRKHRDQLIKLKSAYLGIPIKQNKLSKYSSNNTIFFHKHRKLPFFITFNKLHELHVLKKYFKKMKRKKIAYVIRKNSRKKVAKDEEGANSFFEMKMENSNSETGFSLKTEDKSNI